ncbi:DUF4276 family protein [Belliella kenyensis]|uniref:DUF4276 family protein n=1 Tax=Belliella kenyensis TaxID=1472724 RepID=A0ABV8EMG4_9BACT|nr:DUF4276 family protein [Belliella kenyensis]MCH7400414.1 DUF4276 family protein [Belliella kenyensis]MDN3604569.1 DUF4276 family protein [Belliella kenyensis]
MMRGIYIICEGQTEEEFVNGILRPYFNTYQIYDVRPILMTTSKGHKGGDVNYDRLKFNIDKLLGTEQDILVTTFVDFFRLKGDFPKFKEALVIQNKIQRVGFLEQALAETISHQRFVPYIQLHEFEGLLFAAKDGFEFLPDLKQSNLNKLLLAVEEKENPEELNDGELTAPSKRLEQLIPGFDKSKPFYGGLIAEVNTIDAVLDRCLRFKTWVETLIEKVKV